MGETTSKKGADNGKKIQSELDKLVHSDLGAELIIDLESVAGAIADAYYSPEKNVVAIKLLQSPEEMPYDRELSFKVQDSLAKKEKGQTRFVLRSTALHIYTIQPIEDHHAKAMFAAYELSPEDKQQLRHMLVESLKY